MAGSRIAKTTAIFTRRHAAVTLVVNVTIPELLAEFLLHQILRFGFRG